jgi:DNA primase
VAGRIARRTIELVKERADLVELVAARTGPARRVGGQYMARCPFHDERSASFSIEPEEKLYHCFGCGVSGDVLRFVQELEGLPFDAAVEYLADRYGVEVEREDLPPEEARARQARARLEALLEEAATWYARNLAASPSAAAARAYLADRGVEAASVERFRLGWAPDGWDRLLTAARGKGYRDEEVLAAGLASRGQRGLVDRFRGRITFPLADARGRVRGFGARAMPDGSPPKYLNSPESELFHKGRLLYGLNLARPAIAKGGRAIVVEGYTDVIALHAAGVTEAVAAMGTSLTDEQLRELARLASTVTLCFDADAAGQDAALRGMRAAERLGLRVRIVPLPAGRDPADLLRDGQDAFTAALDAAESVLSFEIGRLLARLDVDGPQAVAAATRAILVDTPVLNPEREQQVRRVASALRLDPEATGALTRVPRAGRGGAAVRLRTHDMKAAAHERELLGAALGVPSRGLRLLDGELDPELLELEAHRALLPWLRARAAGAAGPPPDALQEVAAEVVATAGRYRLPEDAREEDREAAERAVEQLWLRARLRRVDGLMAPLKERLAADDITREGELELVRLGRERELIRRSMRAGPN